MFSEDEIIKVHQCLNRMYEQAREVTGLIQAKDLSCQLLMSSHNYLKDKEGKYHLQHFPIPVIEIVQIGDIGFNLDAIFFEYPLAKAQLMKMDLNHLIEEHEIEIYGGKNCMIDFYCRGDSWDNVQSKVSQSSEEIVMISMYMDYGLSNQVVIQTFLDVGKRLGFTWD